MSITDGDLPGVEPRGLACLTPAELAADEDAARLARSLARMDVKECAQPPLPVAAFNSFI